MCVNVEIIDGWEDCISDGWLDCIISELEDSINNDEEMYVNLDIVYILLWLSNIGFI